MSGHGEAEGLTGSAAGGVEAADADKGAAAGEEFTRRAFFSLGAAGLALAGRELLAMLPGVRMLESLVGGDDSGGLPGEAGGRERAPGDGGAGAAEAGIVWTLGLAAGRGGEVSGGRWGGAAESGS